MNWYKDNIKKRVVKTASGRFDCEDDAAATNQDGEWMTMFDLQRYVMDAYTIRISISETKEKIAVAVVINHAFLGSLGWNRYWTYDKSDFAKAKKVYNKIKKIAVETMSDFIDNETPTSIFWPILSDKLDDVDLEDNVASNIPYVNYSKRYKTSPDWRQNIYGNRYPKYTEPSYAQEMKFWGTQK
jgi:hypothetical protein